MATVAKGYDLDYAWRAVGEAYRGAGYYLAATEAGEPPGTWWGPGAEQLGFVAGQQTEREPMICCSAREKGPDGQKLGRLRRTPRKAVEIYKGLVPNQRELASLMDKANLRTRKGKDGLIDWDAAARGWQAKAAQRAGVDLASVYRRVSRLDRRASAPRDAGPELTQDDTTRAAQKALEKCSSENSKWTRADLVANLGRVLPRRAGDPDGYARLLEEVTDRALAGEFGPVACLEPPEPVPVPASLRRADGRSLYQRHGGAKYATRVQLTREEKLVAQAGVRGGPCMTREEAAAALGADGAELEAVLHEPPGPEVTMTASGLRMDQAAAAFHVLSSARRAELIVGPAGAGKTRVLAQIGKAWSRGRVVGVTPSQSSRDVLVAAGITESYNFAQFLGHLRDRRGAHGFHEPLGSPFLVAGTGMSC